MASTSAGPSTAATTTQNSATKSSRLYAKCAETDARQTGAIFYQTDLAGFSIADDNEELKNLCEELTAKHLFQVLIESGQLCWRIRSRDSAQILSSLTADQRMLYTQIEATGSSGIWVKTLKTKTNLAQTVVTKALKQLESQRLIKEIKSAKYQGRRIWMLYNLDPSEENTGGTFFTDGKIDEGLIEVLKQAIAFHVTNESWREAKLSKPSKSAGPAATDASLLKRKRDAVEGEGPEPARYKPMMSSRNNNRPLVPAPHSFTTYPTPSTVTHFLKTSGVIKDLAISVDDVKQLMENMVYDGLLERVGMGFRTVRTVPDEDEEGEGNGFTGAPCGSCPVFSVCGPGNVISAETCEYFEEWLKW